jgi:hypothetical protein
MLFPCPPLVVPIHYSNAVILLRHQKRCTASPTIIYIYTILSPVHKNMLGNLIFASSGYGWRSKGARDCNQWPLFPIKYQRELRYFCGYHNHN